jgi:DNA-binding response OmpR family regulator
MLCSAGYLVTCAHDGRDALRQLAQPSTPIDVVLLDEEVAPYGNDSLVKLRRVDAAVPVLVIADLPARQANAARHAALLLKPFTRADVVSAIEELRQPQQTR